MTIDKVIELLAEQLNVDKATITKDTRIVEDLHADSLDVVEMLIALEDEFHISVPDEDAKGLNTVGAIAEYVDKNIKK
ncbi:MAG: acyl carrier protein [Clostridia bacterium]|nr:acyl carrier protein [Clostridia bacterium]